MSIDTLQPASQQVLVITDNPHGVMEKLLDLGRSGNLVFPCLDRVAEDPVARAALRSRMTNHQGPVVVDPKMTIVSPLFIALGIRNAEILPV